jgi:hypothetical protein
MPDGCCTSALLDGSFPISLYASVTGVILYVLLKHFAA